jgi:hypothetical protein
LTGLISKDRPIIATVARAAVLAEVSEATIRRRLRDGDGVREFARPPASRVNDRTSAQPVLLVYVPYEDALPPEYVTDPGRSRAPAAAGDGCGFVSGTGRFVSSGRHSVQVRGRCWAVVTRSGRQKCGHPLWHKEYPHLVER